MKNRSYLVPQFFAFFTGLLFALLLMSLISIDMRGIMGEGMTQMEAITTILTATAVVVAAVGVIVTVLAVFIALMAFVGQRQIKKEAQKTAEERVVSSVVEGLKDGTLREIVKDRVDVLLTQTSMGDVSDFEVEDDKDD